LRHSLLGLLLLEAMLLCPLLLLLDALPLGGGVRHASPVAVDHVRPAVDPLRLHLLVHVEAALWRPAIAPRTLALGLGICRHGQQEKARHRHRPEQQAIALRVAGTRHDTLQTPAHETKLL
jgi:hypothetical protein